MPPLDFITTNIFADKFRANRADDRKAAADEAAAEGLRLKAGRDAEDRARALGVDAARRRAVVEYQGGGGGAPQPQATGGAPGPAAAPQPSLPSFSDISARHLAGVPGGGDSASKMTLGEIERQQTVMQKTFEMAVENPDIALQMAEQNGVPVPPELQGMLRNRQTAAQIATLLAQLDKQYSGAINAKKKWLAFQSALKGMAAQTQGGREAVSKAAPIAITGQPEPGVAPVNVSPGNKLVDPTTGKEIFSSPAAPQKPTIASPGQQGFDATGKQVFSVPATTQKPTIASPGQQGFDASGKKIFGVPATPQKPTIGRPGDVGFDASGKQVFSVPSNPKDLEFKMFEGADGRQHIVSFNPNNNSVTDLGALGAEKIQTATSGQGQTVTNVRTGEEIASTPAAQRFAPRIITITDNDGNSRVMSFDPNTNALTDFNLEGSVNRRGQTQSVWQVKYNAWLAAPGNRNDVNGALEYAAGRRTVAPAQARKWAHDMAVKEAEVFVKGYNEPNFVSRRTEEIFQTLMGAQKSAAVPAGQKMSGAGSMVSPYTPQVKADMQKVKSGEFYVNPADGKIYRKK